MTACIDCGAAPYAPRARRCAPCAKRARVDQKREGRARGIALLVAIRCERCGRDDVRGRGARVCWDCMNQRTNQNRRLRHAIARARAGKHVGERKPRKPIKRSDGIKRRKRARICPGPWEGEPCGKVFMACGNATFCVACSTRRITRRAQFQRRGIKPPVDLRPGWRKALFLNKMPHPRKRRTKRLTGQAA